MSISGYLTVQRNPLLYNAKDFNAQGDGITDDTGALQAAIAALPTVTIFANPGNSTGTSATYHYGTIFLPRGNYKIGSSGDLGNIGPFVSLLGAGHNATKLSYYGSGDALRLFNAVNPTSGTFDTLAAWAGKIDGLTIDGTNAGAGATGLHYGDTEGGSLGPDLYIQNFSGANSNGVLFDNSVSWTENNYGRIVVNNCTNCVVFTVSTVGANNSFEYNDLLFKVYCNGNQNGIVLKNGAYYANGRLALLGNFALSSVAQSSAALTITGQYNGGQYSQITFCHLDIQVEIDTVLAGGTNPPQTIKLGSVSNNAIYNCIGVMNFFNGSWTASNWSVQNSFGAGNVTYMGQVNGDTNIAPNVHGAFGLVGALIYGASQGYANGGMPLSAGDFFPLTLSQNMTVALQNNTAGPQRKIFIFQQAAAGGPFTVTWPKPGSPSTGSPAVYWAGGVAPTMTATANAVDVYELVTIDGIRWYGRAMQNMS